jgi:hypothetical protein
MNDDSEVNICSASYRGWAGFEAVEEAADQASRKAGVGSEAAEGGAEEDVTRKVR